LAVRYQSVFCKNESSAFLLEDVDVEREPSNQDFGRYISLQMSSFTSTVFIYFYFFQNCLACGELLMQKKLRGMGLLSLFLISEEIQLLMMLNESGPA
jgi:hypothetical protein